MDHNILLQWKQSYKSQPDQRSFLDLPRELRDKIYEHAFVVPGAIMVYSQDSFTGRDNAKATIVRLKDEGPSEPRRVTEFVPLGLLKVCRQVHAEGMGFLYSLNAFRIYSTKVDFAPLYRDLVRHVIFTTDSMNHHIFGNSVTFVDYSWRRYFWPDVLAKSTKVLETWPHLHTLVFPMKPNRVDWRPAFMSSVVQDRRQRIMLTAAWLKKQCPFTDERLRDCLQLEVIPNPSIDKKLYEGSRFAFEYEWDAEEFTEAFNMMKFM